jgi:hypothetical protein
VTQEAHSPLFFATEEEAARAWGLSPNALAAARQRGELEGCYVMAGRRILWAKPALRLRAAGVVTPCQLGQLVRAMGIADLDSLMAFLTGK